MRRPGTAAALAALALLAVVLILAADPAQAANTGPFGVGLPEAAVPTGGIFGWIAARQTEFYAALRAAIRLARTDPAAVWSLAAMSLLYGVAHAAGPGHGKAVISAYVIANGETLRRGILLAFVSAFIQSLTAVVLIGAAVLVLNLTSMAITDATLGLELASGAAISILGASLLLRRLWRPKIVPAAPAATSAEPVPAPAARPGLRYHGKLVRPAEVCVDCGQIHMPTPDMLQGDFSWRKAAGAVVAVGLRPCTGALVVLTFAFSLKLWWAGLVSVLAMGFGTGVTVAILATLAVTMRDVALRLTGDRGHLAARIVTWAEILGALAILALGILILGAALVGGTPMAG